MTQSIKALPKKRGRPATGKDPLVNARLPIEMITQLDERAKAEGIPRSELIRRLIQIGLQSAANAQD